jgi:hypothetical protein
MLKYLLVSWLIIPAMAQPMPLGGPPGEQGYNNGSNGQMPPDEPPPGPPRGNGPNGQGGRIPIIEISRDLGIQPEQFQKCLGMPPTQGERPTGPHIHENKQVMLACLQEENPNITQYSLDSVMDKYRHDRIHQQQ